MPVACLIDTDVLSEIRRAIHPQIARHARAYLQHHGRFSLSLITRYEVLRGLKSINATAQLATFEAWCAAHHVLPLDEPVVALASDLYAHLRQTGQPIGDNDLFIAATALHHGFSLATRNLGHFTRIPGLTVEDWTAP